MPKKVFLSYAYTGEDAVVLRRRLERFRQLFEDLGLDYYINMFAEEWQSMTDRKASGGEFLQFALSFLDTCDVMYVLNTSPRRSEGMLMEVGAAKALNKKIIFAQHMSSVGQTYLPTVADQAFVWQDDAELFEKTKAIFSA